MAEKEKQIVIPETIASAKAQSTRLGSRRSYLLALVVAILLGLASRRFRAELPFAIANYGGDTLWGCAVYCGLGIGWPSLTRRFHIAVACAIAAIVELSQLWSLPILVAIRQTPFGRLLLGVGFLWSDIVCYTIGIAAAAAIDHQLRQITGRYSTKQPTQRGV